MIKKKLIQILFFLILIFFINSCSLKRTAIGADNEIRVIRSDIDKPIIKEYLESIFTDTLYTPQPEPYYYLKYTTPSNYNRLKSQNHVIVAAIEQSNGNPGYKLIKQLLPKNQFDLMANGDPILFAKDVHSYDQLFMIINAQSKDQLFSTIENKKNFIRQQYFEQFKKRQLKYIFGDDRNNSLEDSLRTMFGWLIKIPWGWEAIKIKEENQFVWIGKEMPFQWIGISWENKNIVDEELKLGEYLWKWPTEYYGTIQFSEYKFKLDQTKLNKHNAWRATGIWETINIKDAKGGPFCSYIFYDEKHDRTYHLNYLIHHPGSDKSIFMRQLDMIVKSINIHL